MGKQTEDAIHFGDVVTKAMNATALGFSDFDYAMQYVASSAQKYGLQFEEVTALLGVMAEKGLKGSSAGRGLSAIMTNVYAPNKRAAEALGMLGINPYDKSGKQRNFIDILEQMQKKYKKLNDEQRNQIALFLAGKDHIKSFDKIMSTNIQTIRTWTQEFIDSQDESARQSQENQNNLIMQMEKLKNKLTILWEDIGTVVIPIVSKIVDKISEFVDKLQEKWDSLSEERKEKIAEMLVKLPAILIGAGAILKVLTTITTIIKGFGMLSTILKGIPLLFNPIVLAIAAVGLAVFLIIKYWDKIWDAIKRFGKWIGGFFKKVWDGILNFFKKWGVEVLAVVSPVIGLPLLIAKHWESIKGFFSNLWEGVKETFNRFKEWIVNNFTWESIKERVSKAWEGIKSFFSETFNKIGEWAASLGEKIARALGINIQDSESLENVGKKIDTALTFVPGASHLGALGVGSAAMKAIGKKVDSANISVNNYNTINNTFDYAKFNSKTVRDLRRAVSY